MNSSRGNLTSCFNCGSPNVTGVRSCRNCHAPYYYNCPHCHSWVDNSFSNCPNCRKKLNWPSGGYHTEYAFSPDKSTSSAVVVLLLSSVLLSIVAINLMANNSNPVNAVSHTASIAESSNLPANELKVATQPDIQDSYQITTTPAMTQIAPSTSYTDADVNSAEGSISYETEFILPVAPTSTTTTGTYIPKSSSYLDTLYPNWGHCSGGSCRSYNQ